MFCVYRKISKPMRSKLSMNIERNLLFLKTRSTVVPATRTPIMLPYAYSLSLYEVPVNFSVLRIRYPWAALKT